MAKLTEDNIYKLEHMVVNDYMSVFEMDSKKEMITKAIYLEGVHDMAKAMIDALKEIEKV